MQFQKSQRAKRKQRKLADKQKMLGQPSIKNTLAWSITSRQKLNIGIADADEVLYNGVTANTTKY